MAQKFTEEMVKNFEVNNMVAQNNGFELKEFDKNMYDFLTKLPEIQAHKKTGKYGEYLDQEGKIKAYNMMSMLGYKIVAKSATQKKAETVADAPVAPVIKPIIKKMTKKSRFTEDEVVALITLQAQHTIHKEFDMAEYLKIAKNMCKTYVGKDGKEHVLKEARYSVYIQMASMGYTIIPSGFDK